MKTVSYSKYHRDQDYENFEAMFRNIFRKRVLLIHRYISNGGRVLDVGCSTGIFLELFKDEGWEVWGVEPSESSSVAKSRGIKVIKNYFEKAKLPNNYFDLVVMNHTMEHLRNPLEILRKVNQIVKKNGCLFIDVPNYGGLGSRLLGEKWPYLLPKEHLHQFTKRDLESLLRNTGFKPIHSESRSGIYEFANPLDELVESVVTFKKRFFTNLILFPYSTLATVLNMGDSISIIGKKI